MKLYRTHQMNSITVFCSFP